MFLWKNKKPDIKIIKVWSETNEDFYAPGALVEVCNGKGLLHEVYGEVKKEVYSTLLFGNQPLFQLQGEEYYCPTCEKIMKSGYGFKQTKEFHLNNLNENKEKIAFINYIESIKPLLGLLPSNYYILLDTQLYPTNGNKHLFWEFPNENKSLPGTCVYYFKDRCGTWGNLRPYFTLATQPVSKLSKDRVEYYLKNSNGRAIAYYMDGYMTALLDGHHKTMAAALMHKMVNALVIVPCYNRKVFQEDGTYKNYIGFETMQFESGKYQLKIKEPESWKKISEKEMKKILLKIPKGTMIHKIPYNTEGLVECYPDVDSMANIYLVEEITEKRLDQIISLEVTYSEIDACDLIVALSSLKHKRLLEIADFFLHRHYSGPTLFTIIQVLTKQPRSEELESYLIERLVEFEVDYPDIKRLILGYL
jgi:hypothetical protein